LRNTRKAFKVFGRKREFYVTYFCPGVGSKWRRKRRRKRWWTYRKLLRS
jgi:hypothetical protein